MDLPVHELFTKWDWGVVFAYLLFTTFIGHLMRGKQSTINDFFRGGRTLPWPAVSGSIIATEISGVTFIGVPGLVYAANGDFTYLQWAVGSILARIVVGYFFVPFFFQKDIYSPYDFMGKRLGRPVKALATVIFSIGSILGQSVRVLVAALALDVVTPWPFWVCIIVIGVFAIGWTLLGGMRTVIWTDVIQFGLFVGAGLLALFWMVSSLPGGFGQFWDVASSSGGISSLWTPAAEGAVNKFRILNFETDPSLGFTFWVAIFATPFLNLNAFGVDQLNAQRMFCCKSASDARKAIVFSSFGQLVTLLMLAVGVALYVYYQQHGVRPVDQELFEKSGDYVFPVWITTTLWVGLRGLILAGVFAAAISSLDSILAALSQTTLSLVWKPEDAKTDEEARQLLVRSRILVIGWGLFLSAFAIGLDQMRGTINMVNLAFGMIAYTTGPMLALFLAALWKNFRKAGMLGLTLGFTISFLLVLYVRTDLYTILIKVGWFEPAQIGKLWLISTNAAGDGVISDLNYAWMWPVTMIVTLGLGWLIPAKDQS